MLTTSQENDSPPSDVTDGDTPMTSTSSVHTHAPKRRAALSLPMTTSAIANGSPRMPSMPSLSTYDSVSSSTSPAQLGHGIHRSSDDMANRLPSIRPDGTLLDGHHSIAIDGHQAQLLDGLQSGIPIDPRMSHHPSDPVAQGSLESPFQKHSSIVEGIYGQSISESY